MKRDPYTYEGTNILKNKFDCRDAEELKKLESDNTNVRMFTISKFDSGYEIDTYAHFTAIHAHIFQDVYEWAGNERVINIEKPERVLSGATVQYSEWMDIKRCAISAINAFQNTKWTKLDIDQKTAAFCKHMAALWQAHPFREGNTRTTVIFATNLAYAYGFRMDEKLFANSSHYMRDALVMATVGKSEYLLKIVKDSIVRGQALDFPTNAEKEKYEWLQEIRNYRKPSGNLTSAALYNIHAQKVLENTGNIWRKTTDKETYKSMLGKKISEMRIKEAMKKFSPALTGKDNTFKTEYIKELSNDKEIQAVKVKGRSR
jgi:cell filamentation protein